MMQSKKELDLLKQLEERQRLLEKNKQQAQEQLFRIKLLLDKWPVSSKKVG